LPWTELPDPVEVSLAEISAAISELDDLLRAAEAGGDTEIARALEDIVGRMTRWVCPFLDELDEDGR
jgi:hypothetical protein